MYRVSILATVALLLAFAPSAVGQIGPDGWWSQTIGSGTEGDAVEVDDGVYDVTGNGNDIWGTADAFQYMYKELVGDGSMTARVVSNGSGSNAWAKGGVMIRNELTAGSASAQALITGGNGNGSVFQWRETAGASAAPGGDGPSPGVTPPYWVRIIREGDTFRGERSADGVEWLEMNPPHTVVMNETVYLGIAVTSHASGELRTFQFDNITWVGEVIDRPPQLKAWQPSPADGAEGVTSPLFEWTKGETGLFSNVYFGTDPNDLPQVAANQPFDLYFHPQPLEAGTTYYWRVDQVEADMATIHIGDVWSFTVTPESAWSPSPADEGEGVFPAPTLTWSAGQNGLQHQVYFGADQAAVAAGDAATDQGVVDVTEWAAPILRSSSTYHWRVDEIALDGTVTEGEVWSFTTADGAASAIVREVWTDIGGTAVSALTGDPDYPNNPSTRELTDQFDGPVDWADNYGIRMYGWLIPPETADYVFTVAGDDFHSLVLSTDEDPANAEEIAIVPGWTNHQEWEKYPEQTSEAISLMAGQKYFIQVLGKEGGGGDSTTVAWQGGPFAGRTVISAEYVDAFALPPLTAFGPRPADGAVDTTQSPILTWAAGENATQHDVYFGDDEAAVAAADPTTADIYRGRQGGTSFNPGALEWAKTYYWRVDEVEADGTIRAGKVWVFTTANFIPIDDFETYTNEVGSRIFQFWIDGLGFTEPAPGDPGNGSTALVGHDIWSPDSPYFEGQIVETANVQSGLQAMPLYYNNSGAPFYAQADHALAPAVDMASNGVTDLSLWVLGAPLKFQETAPGSVTMSGGGADIWGTADEFRFAYKSLNGNGSITARVDSFDNLNAWTKVGLMIRESLDTDAKHAMVAVTGGNGAQFAYRTFTGDVSDDAGGDARAAGIEAPVWLKLTRTGNTLQGQYSEDGVVWNDFVDADGNTITEDITMMGNVYVGLAVLSHVSGSAAVAEYSEITTTGATGQWQVEDVGVAQPGNAPDEMYVGLSSGGALSTVSAGQNPVLSTDRVNVKVPLADFAGVNLSAVSQISIGVGNPASPMATGDGMIIVDNIRVVKPEPVEEPNDVSEPITE
jgi:hypothetical protein